jgi:hypothetical protein
VLVTTQVLSMLQSFALAWLALAERITLPEILLLSAFQGVWHAAYWDVHVAPEHNVPEWNLRKVVLCHVPNLLATLTFYAVSGSAVWFVVLQTVSLVLSATAMRFPRPSRAEPAVSQA